MTPRRPSALSWSLMAAISVAVAACEETGSESCFTRADAEAGANVGTKYDRFSDSTLIGYSNPWPNTDAMAVMVSDSVSPVRLMLAGFACPGRTRCQPSTVTIMFSQYAKSRRPLSGAESVRFLVDGSERLTFPTAYHAPDVKGSGDYRAYEGVVGVDAPYEEFASIVCADSVEFRVGTTEGVLSPEDLASLRKMFSDMPLDELSDNAE